MDTIVHYRNRPIAITARGFRAGDTTYPTLGEAKAAIARNINRSKRTRQ